MDNEITKFPKEYITDVPTPKIPSVNMIRDSRNRLVLELPSKDRIMVSIDPGSKITSTATETATGATDNYRGEDIKVNSISIDNILDGDNYQRVKSVAINSDGMVVLDQTIEGDYSLVLSTDIQAGSILLSKTIQSTLFRTVSDTEKATWDAAEAGITKSDTAPEDPEANDLWIDTSDTPSVLKRWTGSEWVLCSVGNIDDLADGVTYQRVKSASLTESGLILLDQVSIGDTYGLLNKTDISGGHVILDTVEQAGDGTYALVLRTAIDAGKIILTGSAGVSGTLPDDNIASAASWDADIAQAITDASTAQSTADGKITTFYTDDRPEAEGCADLWVDTNDNNSLHRWAGTYAYANYYLWTANTVIIYIGTLYRPVIYNGFLFQVTQLGTTGLIEPIWDITPGNTTNDGTVIWTCVDNWIIIDSTNIQLALDNAATAQSTADGKIISFYQDEPPTAEGIGDLWIDTNDSKKLYRWDGADWILVQSTKIDALAAMAYESMVEAAKLGTTIIEGGYLKTELINCNTLSVGTVPVSMTAAKCTNPNADQTQAVLTAGANIANTISGSSGSNLQISGNYLIFRSNTSEIAYLYTYSWPQGWGISLTTDTTDSLGAELRIAEGTTTATAALAIDDHYAGMFRTSSGYSFEIGGTNTKLKIPVGTNLYN